MAAYAYGHRDVVQLLLSRGAALEVEGSRFLSAAGTARAFRKTVILEILDEHTNRTGTGKNVDQVEGGEDGVSAIVKCDHSMIDEHTEEEEASSTASSSDENDVFYEALEPKRISKSEDTVVLPGPQEASRQDA